MWSVVLRPGRKPHCVAFNVRSSFSRHLFVKGLDNVNVDYLKNSQKASRAAQKVLAGHMRAACLRPLP